MMNQMVATTAQGSRLIQLQSFRRLVCFTACLFPLIGMGAGFSPRDNGKASGMANERPYQSAVHLIEAAANLATERGLVYSALHSPEKVSEDALELIQSIRTDASENFKLALESFDEKDKAELSLPRYNYTQKLQELEKLRLPIDQQLAIGLAERDLTLADKWFEQATDTIESIDRLSRYVNQEIGSANPTLRRILMLQRSALMMREQVGLERAILSSAAEGAELRISQLAILRDYRIVQPRFADVVDLTARDAIGDPNLAKALSVANVEVHDTYQDIRARMLDRSANDVPITAADWFESATRTIDALNALILAIVDYAQKKLETG